MYVCWKSGYHLMGPKYGWNWSGEVRWKRRRAIRDMLGRLKSIVTFMSTKDGNCPRKWEHLNHPGEEKKMLGTHTQSKALRYTSFLLSGLFSDTFFKKVVIRKEFVLSNFNSFLAGQMMFWNLYEDVYKWVVYCILIELAFFRGGENKKLVRNVTLWEHFFF